MRTITVRGTDATKAFNKGTEAYNWRLQYMRGRTLMYGSYDPEEAAADALLMERYA